MDFVVSNAKADSLLKLAADAKLSFFYARLATEFGVISTTTNP